MAKIGLSDGFSLIPEGTHIFKITGVSYKEAFGKLEITMQTQSGAKHIERFSLLKTDGSPNEGALNAFSYFAKTALQDFELTEIDHEDLVGHFIECDIEHDVQPKSPPLAGAWIEIRHPSCRSCPVLNCCSRSRAPALH